MKHIKIVAAVAAILSIGVIIAVAQMSHRGGPGRHFGGFANHHEKFLGHLSERLNLTEQQKAQAKQVFADAKPRVEPLLAQLKETHKASMDEGLNGVFDEQKSQQTAARQAEIIKQLLLEKDRTKAAIFAVLTPEQREQAKRMMNEFVENFGH